MKCVPTNPQNPIANKLPVVKIFGGERGFFSVSHGTVFVSHARLSETRRFAVVWLVVVIIDERYITFLCAQAHT